MSGLVGFLGGGCWAKGIICLLLITEVGTQQNGSFGNEKRGDKSWEASLVFV